MILDLVLVASIEFMICVSVVIAYQSQVVIGHHSGKWILGAQKFAGEVSVMLGFVICPLKSETHMQLKMQRHFLYSHDLSRLPLSLPVFPLLRLFLFFPPWGTIWMIIFLMPNCFYFSNEPFFPRSASANFLGFGVKICKLVYVVMVDIMAVLLTYGHSPID